MGYFVVFAILLVSAYAWYRWIQLRDNIDEDVTWDDGEREEPLSQ
ncbi:MAG: hypothetical protein ABIV13_04115 [Fimbriimonadales bacterium]